MRELDIDEEFDIPYPINKEQMIEDIILSPKYSDCDVDYETFYSIVSEVVDEEIDFYTHVNGKVYIEDWGEFENDIDSRIVDKLETMFYK